MTTDTSDLWIVAWRARGRDKREAFVSKGEATQLVRDLLASDCDLVVFSRVPISVTFKVANVKTPPEEK